MRSGIFLLIIAVCVAGDGLGAQASRINPNTALARRADSLAALDPERQAQRAFTRGDFRLVVIHGYSLELPGVPAGMAPTLRQVYGVRTIAGTSDALVGRAAARLQAVAHEYARRYNRRLLELERAHDRDR